MCVSFNGYGITCGNAFYASSATGTQIVHITDTASLNIWHNNQSAFAYLYIQRDTYSDFQGYKVIQN
jgi:hypothetical protein